MWNECSFKQTHRYQTAFLYPKNIDTVDTFYLKNRMYLVITDLLDIFIDVVFQSIYSISEHDLM